MPSYITNVKVFNGHGLSDLTTVSIRDGRIVGLGAPSPSPEETDVFDGRGLTLLPGLIDAHVHVEQLADLQAARSWGVTTLFDLANVHPEILPGFAADPSLPQVFSARYPATALGSKHTKTMGFPQSSVVTSPADAERFVAEQIDGNARFIKVVIDEPGFPGSKPLPQDVVAAIVTAAHDKGLLTIVHAVGRKSFENALLSQADVLTHSSLNPPPTEKFLAGLPRLPIALIPTLGIMKEMAGVFSARRALKLIGTFVPRLRMSERNVDNTVQLFRQAGIPLLAGTDANRVDGPFQIPEGSALHDELRYLVAAGLSPAEALEAATSRTANLFGLSDRGEIVHGKRADLVLVEGDPTVDIEVTRNVRAVWIAGELVISSSDQPEGHVQGGSKAGPRP